MGDLSPHFSLREFVDRRTGDHPLPSVDLVEHLEMLRARGTGPIVIVSGYRCLATNHAVGGAELSRHTFGDAVDIRPGICHVSAALDLGFTGVGVRGEWAIHLDVRPGPVATWTYPLTAQLAEGPPIVRC